MPIEKLLSVGTNEALLEKQITLGQVIQSLAGTVNTVSGTTQIPYDNSRPLITEGFQLFSITVTPKSPNSKLLFICNLNVHNDNNLASRVVTAVVFAGSAIAYTHSTTVAVNQQPTVLPIATWIQTGNTSPFVLQVRVGSNNTGTTYVGGSGSATLNNNRSTDWMLLEVLDA